MKASACAYPDTDELGEAEQFGKPFVQDYEREMIKNVVEIIWRNMVAVRVYCGSGLRIVITLLPSPVFMRGMVFSHASLAVDSADLVDADGLDAA